MEVPPFQRPKPALFSIILSGFKIWRATKCKNVGHGEMGGELGLCTAQAASRVSSPWSSMLAMEMGCPHPSWNTDQGVKQTRKGGDMVASTSLVLKGRCKMHLWCAHVKSYFDLPNTDRPSVGCVGVCLFGPERWWTMPEQGEARGNPGGGL